MSRKCNMSKRDDRVSLHHMLSRSDEDIDLLRNAVGCLLHHFVSTPPGLVAYGPGRVWQ